MGRASDSIEPLLDEQMAYYDARAGEYDLDMWQLDQEPDIAAEFAELERALDDFRPSGDVLELGCGTGAWTSRLRSSADRLTAVDSSPRMIARARRKAGDAHVDFVHADLFAWSPPRRFDVVFFSFVLSHVPPRRFDAFWGLVRDCLRPGGRVFFIDEADEAAHEEPLPGGPTPLVRRRLRDGREFRVVKVFLDPPQLEADLRRRGWDVRVHRTARIFYWGSGSPDAPPAP